jgi:hypothetical protein
MTDANCLKHRDRINVLSLPDERRVTVDTATAAYYLNRQPQTMRAWASSERGPLRPLRLGGRLAWSVREIKHLLAEAL